MAFMAQPSFLIAPDSSGHQFYSARLFTRNPLTNQLDRLVGRIAENSCEPACTGRQARRSLRGGVRVGAAVERVPDYSVPGGR